MERILTTCFIATLILSGCGSGMSAGSSGSSSSSYPDNPGAGGSLKDIQYGSASGNGVKTFSIDEQSITPPTLQGGWSMPCSSSRPGLEPSGSSTVNLIVQGNYAFVLTVIYSDAACSSPSYRTITYYEFDSEGTASSNNSATATNTTLQWQEIQPLSAEGATLLNSQNSGAGFCNINTWDGSYQYTNDVTGLACMGGETAGTVQYTIFQLSGSTLKLGTASGGLDGTTASNRFSTLGYTYTR